MGQKQLCNGLLIWLGWQIKVNQDGSTKRSGCALTPIERGLKPPLTRLQLLFPPALQSAPDATRPRSALTTAMNQAANDAQTFELARLQVSTRSPSSRRRRR